MPDIKLIPIQERFEDNQEFMNHPDCKASLEMSVLFYVKVGYRVPWIGYYASMNNKFVGAAGFKGKPINDKVEIAYGTFPAFQKMGIGTEMCRQLVMLALTTNPSVRISARTLMEDNYSVRILKNNNFQWHGVVVDPDDGEVWEWEYKKTN